jgi:hypothetical protein
VKADMLGVLQLEVAYLELCVVIKFGKNFELILMLGDLLQYQYHHLGVHLHGKVQTIDGILVYQVIHHLRLVLIYEFDGGYQKSLNIIPYVKLHVKAVLDCIHRGIGLMKNIIVILKNMHGKQI